MRRWWSDNWPVVVFCGLLLNILGGLVFMAVSDGVRERERKRAFMGQCREDHKQYECDALWGQANADKGGTTVFIPMAR